MNNIDGISDSTEINAGDYEDESDFIHVVIVDNHNLFRDSIALLLRTAEPNLHVLEANSPEDIPTVQGDPRKTIFIVSDTDHERALESIEILTRRAPGSACVMLATGDDPAHAVKSLKRGAMGIIGTNTPTEVIPHILRLIVAGGTHVSSELLLKQSDDRAAAGGGYPENPELMVRYLPELTRKQLQVTRLLAMGWPNGEIANGLHMRENTVKAHVGQIIRKLGLRNRTEVALLVSRRAAGDTSGQ